MESSNTEYVLSKEIMDELKCSLCKKYLSLPPISIISEDGKKYKCGRCPTKMRIDIRAIMYENLAKHMTFPCIYKVCPEKLSWADVEHHEKDCRYRTLPCIAPDCYDEISQSEFLLHLKEKHRTPFYKNKMSKKNFQTDISVLENDNECYIVLVHMDDTYLKISVCSFEIPDKKVVDIILNSKGSKHSIAFRQHNIIQFDEKYHCCKCLIGKCDNTTHSHYSPRKKAVSAKILRQFIKRTFGSCNITCNIFVTEKEDPNDDLEDILLCKDAIIDEVNDEEDRETDPDDDLEDLLQCKDVVVDEINDEEDIEKSNPLIALLFCPTCNDPIKPPIFQCSTGHSMCTSCKNKSDSCFCGAAIGNTRNYILEETMANFKSAKQKVIVETNKTLRKEIICPLSRCFDKIKLKEISDHFRQNHLEHYHFNKLRINDYFGYYSVDVLVKDKKTYIVLFDFDEGVFGISMCSLEPDQRKYEVQLIADKRNRSVTSTNQEVVMFNDKEHCLKCTIGVCKSSDHTFRKKRKEVFRHLTTKINRDSIRRVFNTDSISCNITLLDSRGSSNEIFRQLFECPICKDYMVPPIAQCVAGHTLCSVCKSKVEKCPSCEGSIKEMRNYFLEKISEAIEIPCLYESENCTFKAGIKRIASHELQCPLNPKKVRVGKTSL